MAEAEPRADLVRSLLQSCYVIETARANVQHRWGGDFLRDEEAARERAGMLRDLLASKSIPEPHGVIERHTDWIASLCGQSPTEVFLGAAFLHRLGAWSDVYAGPYIEDRDRFVELGKIHTIAETELQPMTEALAFLPEQPLPEGRRFVILTDIHIGSHGRSELAHQAVADINALAPEFVVIPGDITEDGEPEQFAEAKAILDGLDVPFYTVLGNHDAVQRSTREGVGATLFQDAFGRPATDHVIECGPLQIALIDSTDPVASPFPDWDLTRGGFRDDAGGVDSGALVPGQAEAIAERVDPQHPVLIVEHHELHPFPGFPPVKFAIREEDSEALLAAFANHRVAGVVAGHTHRSAVLPVGDGSVMQLEIPSLKDWPFAYSVAGVTDDAVTIAVRQVSDRDAIWSRSKDLTPIFCAFANGPLASLTHRFPF